MSPPGGGPLWRELHTGGAVIDGVYIPEGYDVGVGIHSIHHNPAYYPEPFTVRNGSKELRRQASGTHGAYADHGGTSVAVRLSGKQQR